MFLRFREILLIFIQGEIGYIFRNFVFYSFLIPLVPGGGWIRKIYSIHEAPPPGGPENIYHVVSLAALVTKDSIYYSPC